MDKFRTKLGMYPHPPSFRTPKKIDISDITAITVNYMTTDLIEQSINSFRSFYPETPIIIIDNSNFDDSTEWIYKFAKQDRNTSLIIMNRNMHHGPGMHQGILLANTKKILLFDTDITFLKDGLLETMIKCAPPNRWYGVGNIEMCRGAKYVHPRCMLLNKEEYLKHNQFIRHGAPCIRAMLQLRDLREPVLVDFDCYRFVLHEKRGTVKRTGGYHL